MPRCRPAPTAVHASRSCAGTSPAKAPATQPEERGAIAARLPPSPPSPRRTSTGCSMCSASTPMGSTSPPFHAFWVPTASATVGALIPLVRAAPGSSTSRAQSPHGGWPRRLAPWLAHHGETALSHQETWPSRFLRAQPKSAIKFGAANRALTALIWNGGTRGGRQRTKCL